MDSYEHSVICRKYRTDACNKNILLNKLQQKCRRGVVKSLKLGLMSDGYFKFFWSVAGEHVGVESGLK